MSRLFYDHLIILEKLEVELALQEFDPQEKEEINQLVEESVHFRVMTRVLNHLPREHHQEFLKVFHQTPYSKDILAFLKGKISDIEEIIKEEVSLLEKELLKDIKSPKPAPKRGLKLKKRG